MDNLRFKAVKDAVARPIADVKPPIGKTSEYFASMTFNKKAMREHLSEDVFNEVMDAIEKGKRIDRKISNQVATSLKSWAISKGATHYTHWFQPLTGSTAEKHDSFFSPVEGGGAIENFQGSQLIQQEPDASSFPNGGIRNTFEARGYTAWDPTSPAFILDNTLCIPTIFVSYTGEALDYKTPLLRALNEVDKATVDVLKYFDKDTIKVISTLGWEQEYFLIDTDLYNARPDLVLTGRTLFGHASAKDQQLDDHYFGAIPSRVMAFMKDFEFRAHELGIPVKTRHNEVAPNQFECAPVYEEANLAVDHNQLLMHLIKKVARKHHLTVLLHEKPFAKVNGSGKHNNWSLQTDKGENLLSPGKDPKSNLRFLTIFINTIKAVHENSDLLRAAIATSGNDHRLGANEAPPAIFSVFVGTHLSNLLDKLENAISGKGELTAEIKNELNLNISKIPEILLDNTDRNRTSSFAFTGNKFEFRAVGSMSNCSKAMITLNTAFANQMKLFKNEVDSLIKKGVKKNDAILSVLKRYITESKSVRYEGNCYSEEWEKEAKKRGLANIKNTPEALNAFVTDKSIKLYSENNVLSEREIRARYEILLEDYTKKIQIESRVIGDLANNHILPIAFKYQNTLIKNVKGLKEIYGEKEYISIAKVQLNLIKQISDHIEVIKTAVDNMIEERKVVNKFESYERKALDYNKKIIPYFEIIRERVDKLELIVDDELWPLPKYRELLFIN